MDEGSRSRQTFLEGPRGAFELVPALLHQDYARSRHRSTPRRCRGCTVGYF